MMGVLHEFLKEAIAEHERRHGPTVPLEEPATIEIERCAECGVEISKGSIGTCEQCTADIARGYSIKYKTGRRANGAQRDSGTVNHAVPLNEYTALCGTQPGRLSDWSSYPQDEVTCSRCLRKIEKEGLMMADKLYAVLYAGDLSKSGEIVNKSPFVASHTIISEDDDYITVSLNYDYITVSLFPCHPKDEEGMTRKVERGAVGVTVFETIEEALDAAMEHNLLESQKAQEQLIQFEICKMQLRDLRKSVLESVKG